VPAIPSRRETQREGDRTPVDGGQLLPCLAPADRDGTHLESPHAQLSGDPATPEPWGDYGEQTSRLQLIERGVEHPTQFFRSDAFRSPDVEENERRWLALRAMLVVTLEDARTLRMQKAEEREKSRVAFHLSERS
jgi:hypothetical protein